MESARRWPRGALLAFGVAAVLATVVRLHRADLPLERDEGEYAYGAQLILDGAFSYDALRTLKLPGVHLTLAGFFAILGETPRAARVALLVFDLGSALALLRLARYFVSAWTAALAAASFVWLQASVVLLGLFAHAENFALFPVLLGLWVTCWAVHTGRAIGCLAGGLAFGVAALMKQPAALFAPLAVIGAYLAARRSGQPWQWLWVAPFVAACALPWALVAIWMAASGGFESFWSSTVTYARSYTAETSSADAVDALGEQLRAVWFYQPAFLLLAAAGCVGLVLRREVRPIALPFLGLLVAGAAATSVGFYYRSHYFVFVLPAFAAAAALGAQSLATWTARSERAHSSIATGVVALCALVGAWRERDVLFLAEPDAVVRRLYFPQPFADSAAIAALVQEIAGPEDTVAVLGSEPQIPFLADRRSATGFVYMYPLMESHPRAAEMQERAIAEIEAARPRALVYVNVSASWLARSTSVKGILEWYPTFARREYRLARVVEFVSPTESRWHDADAWMRLAERPKSFVAVYARRDGP